MSRERRVLGAVDDQAAAEYYEDPENRKPAGPATKRTTPAGRFSSHVPVRFRPEVIAKVRLLADQDGQTVSGWIRSLVEREVARRLPSPPRTEGIKMRFFMDSNTVTTTTGLEKDSPTVVMS